MTPRGFNGKVTNTSLHDIIQLICIGRVTCRMQVKSRGKAGSIYFRDGEIIHAHSDGAIGEDAFFGILSWERGAFECDGTPPDKESIQENWDFLLMESMRRIESLGSS